MLEHIVKNNETIDSICNLYHISEMELKWNNSHITDWNNIPFGVKLWIPTLSVDTEQILEKTEPFVMDYYPEISDDIIPNINDNVAKETVSNDVDNIMDNKESLNPKNNIGVYRTMNQNFRAYSGILPPKKPYKGR